MRLDSRLRGNDEEECVDEGWGATILFMYGLDYRLRGNDNRVDTIEFILLIVFRNALTLGVIPAEAGI
jgi:hypothetical protein